MTRAVAVNVAANTNEPGFRGPVYPDGSFAYVPIPESAVTLPPDRFPVDEPMPTYADLDLPFSLPEPLRDRPVHMDPEFPGVHGREHATYGDPYAIKAAPIADLEPGDWLLFYATLALRPHGWRGPGADDPNDDSTVADASAVADDLAPDWGAYLFAGIRVGRVLDAPDRETAADVVPTNAHLKRDPFDARVAVAGDPDESGLFDRVIPLSTPTAGSDANGLVTELSSDSGKGPWWRRPMRFDEAATATVLDRVRRS
ncbi:hypothetical protein DQW50_14715 [Halorubrum sp. 48-1-W]|uniref:Nmad3 family putative nucleotide modification protein n=1 Tax=Halorubrum sp. 48-1-W TaxID=2249761 RepID=UPI000DCEA019|nr:hypothetical protein [Halorubrum sp. 48-1-W]RAW44409.1 hypothetical protein DQW50_14715 [Halorubrum sp. 48-1-W]